MIWNTFVNLVKRFENGPGKPAFRYLYRDSHPNGYITIGSGLMYAHANNLIKDHLGFTVEGAKRHATHAEITKAFNDINKAPKGLPATEYRKYTNITASDHLLEGVFKRRVKSAEHEAKKWFEGQPGSKGDFQKFEDLPLFVRYAVIDMSFNMGVRKDAKGHAMGLNKFVKFKEALHKGDWATAAEHSYRPDCKVGSERNRSIYGWINSETEQGKRETVESAFKYNNMA